MTVNVAAPRRGLRARIPAAILGLLLATGFAVSASTPAEAATRVVYYDGQIAQNTWKWSGHSYSIGALAESREFFSFNVSLIMSGSSTVHSGNQQVYISYAYQNVSIGCGHGETGNKPVRCSRDFL
ncbi:hypothetical protein DCE93_01235 [Agromyces badenianii]|uniref:Uncharacterized protein n=1 Tax=Agromyces badenianii TaxID=2080742 RepID=A0A2S0WT39_9MICO|nr:hypothetical protein [Agromyces badenianii]AWB94461.1 hypothetical protein DCE93_01235 [Agromyces badenianii]